MLNAAYITQALNTQDLNGMRQVTDTISQQAIDDVIAADAPGASFVEPAFAIAAISLGLTVPSGPGLVRVFQVIGQQALVAPFPERYTASSALTIALLTHMVYYVLTTGLGVAGVASLGLSLGAVRAGRRTVAADRAGAI